MESESYGELLRAKHDQGLLKLLRAVYPAPSCPQLSQTGCIMSGTYSLIIGPTDDQYWAQVMRVIQSTGITNLCNTVALSVSLCLSQSVCLFLSGSLLNLPQSIRHVIGPVSYNEN